MKAVHGYTLWNDKAMRAKRRPGRSSGRLTTPVRSGPVASSHSDFFMFIFFPLLFLIPFGWGLSCKHQRQSYL